MPWQLEKFRLRISDVRKKYLSETSKHPISKIFCETLIVAEDKRFIRHNGVDIRGLSRALYRTIFLRKIEGGSTIEQQLVRTLMGWYEKTIFRKMKEICFALVVSKFVPKHEVAYIYLFIAYFGWKMKGIHQTCNTLNINPFGISSQVAAEVVARLKYPQPRIMTKERGLLIARRADHIKHIYNQAYRTRINDETVLVPQVP
ncbi:MAG: transglycosylase domain-containing protein [Proteobacteria bacterium]|nr:transglycosylase domain-containing protein [Pseudomonadota bacterium]